MRAPKVLKSFCTTREAGRILGVSVRTVQLWTEGRLLEAWKTEGGHRRISRESIQRLLAAEPDPRPPLATPENPASTGFTILVADDDDAVLRMYARCMGRWPMQPLVVTARNGAEALVRLGMVRPDLLIVDLKMPDMDRFQILRQLRDMTELAHLTTVIVSGLDPREIARWGGAPAGIPVLPKPIDFARLHDIATIVANRKQRALPVMQA